MNVVRRKKIDSAMIDLADLRARLQVIHDEEQEAFYNMPEGLQTSQRGQAIESAASSLDDGTCLLTSSPH